MDFEVHCTTILPPELSLFNCDKVNSVLQSMTPLRALSSKLFWLHQVVSFSPVIRLIPTRVEPNEGGVVRKPKEFDGRVTGGAAVGVQGEEQLIHIYQTYNLIILCYVS